MLIDLIIVAVLGAGLAWTQRDVSWRAELSDRLRAFGHFVRALLRSHLGHLLVFLSMAALLQWAVQVASSGWASLNPETVTGEVREEERCHDWQLNIRKYAGKKDAFAPSELICPVGGGPYTRAADGHLSCSVHGEAK